MYSGNSILPAFWQPQTFISRFTIQGIRFLGTHNAKKVCQHLQLK